MQAIKDTPIVQQSVVWAMSASSIPIGMALSATLDGREGEVEACAGWLCNFLGVVAVGNSGCCNFCHVFFLGGGIWATKSNAIFFEVLLDAGICQSFPSSHCAMLDSLSFRGTRTDCLLAVAGRLNVRMLKCCGCDTSVRGARDSHIAHKGF